MIIGVTMEAFSHSGCRYSLQFLETNAAYFSAQSKSDILKTTTFSSSAFCNISGKGALNFLGERHIQSQFPVNGDEPDVSIFVLRPAACNALVSSVRSCINGSPPVTTTSFPGNFFALSTIPFIVFKGCALASQLSFTSHQTHPTSQPPRRIK